MPMERLITQGLLRYRSVLSWFSSKSMHPRLWPFRRAVFSIPGTVFLLALLLLAAPTIVSRTPLGRMLALREAAKYGLALDVKVLQIGWTSPLRLSGVKLQAIERNNQFNAAQIDSNLTLLGLLGFSRPSRVEWTLRGISVRASMDHRRFNLEEDLQTLLNSRSNRSGKGEHWIEIRDSSLRLSDYLSSKSWHITKCNIQIELVPDRKQLTFTGVLTEPDGESGAVQCKLSTSERSVAGSSTEAKPVSVGHREESDPTWQIELHGQSLPLSMMSLIHRRFPEVLSGIPGDISGCATGSARLIVRHDGSTSVVVEDLKFTDLKLEQLWASQPRWKGQPASLRGNFHFNHDLIVVQDAKAETDFLTASLDGTYPYAALSGLDSDPLQWLHPFHGTMVATMDLGAIDRKLSGLLPTHAQTKIQSGNATATIDSVHANAVRNSRFSLVVTDLKGSFRDREFAIEPIEFAVATQHEKGSLKTKEIQLTSGVVKADLAAGVTTGSAHFDLDLSRLHSVLNLFVDVEESKLGGLISSNLRWNADHDQRWDLSGTGTAANLQFTRGNVKALAWEKLAFEINASGLSDHPTQLNLLDGTFALTGSDLDLRIQLAQPVANPTRATRLPLTLSGSGNLQSLFGLIAPVLPKKLTDPMGEFEMRLAGDISADSACITTAQMKVTRPSFSYGSRWFNPTKILVDFDGNWSWPSGNFEANVLSVSSETGKANLSGISNGDALDVTIDWSTNMDWPLTSQVDQVAQRDSSKSKALHKLIGKLVNESAPTSAPWRIQGNLSGNLKAKRDGHSIQLETKMSCIDFACLEPSWEQVTEAKLAGLQSHEPLPTSLVSQGKPAQGSSQFASTLRNSHRVAWAEPRLALALSANFDLQNDQTESIAIGFQGDWFDASLQGGTLSEEPQSQLVLHGLARAQMHEFTDRLTCLLGIPIHFVGAHETSLEMRLQNSPDGALALSADGQLGWESGTAGGVEFGPASIPIHLTETHLEFLPTALPIAGGKIHWNGRIHYGSGPITLELQPGLFAESIQLTHAVTNSWLKFLAPPVSKVESIQGTFDATIDEALFVLGSPMKSRAIGQLQIESAQMLPTPMMEQVLDSYLQLRALSRAAPNPERPPANELVTMPAQTIEFDFSNGAVRHKRMLFEIYGQPVACTGNVTLDGHINMLAQFPRDFGLSGKDTMGSADDSIIVPVSGTIVAPRIDPTGLSNIKTILTSKPASNVRKQMQKQRASRNALLRDVASFVDDLKHGFDSDSVRAGDTGNPKQ